MRIHDLYKTILIILLGHNTEGCPKGCQCENHKVDCRDTILDEFPEFTTIPKETREINIPSSKIKEFQEVSNTTSGFEDVWAIWLNDNLFQEVNGSKISEVFVNLKSLDLRSNQLTRINDGYFSGLANLRFLYLDRNEIQNLSTDSFQDLVNLTKLYLSHNRITVLDLAVLSPLKQLNSLDISQNIISSCKSVQLGWPKMLSLLDLSGNKLRIFPPLPETLLSPSTFSSQWKVDFSDNPVNCGCIHPTMRQLYVVFPSFCNLHLDCASPKRILSHSYSDCVHNDTIKGQLRDMFKYLALQPLCFPPSISDFKKHQSINSLQYILECKVNGYPSPNITIMDEKGKMLVFKEGSDKSEKGKTLFHSEDRTKALYVCVAENIAGQAEEKLKVLMYDITTSSTSTKRFISTFEMEQTDSVSGWRFYEYYILL